VGTRLRRLCQSGCPRKTRPSRGAGLGFPLSPSHCEKRARARRTPHTPKQQCPTPPPTPSPPTCTCPTSARAMSAWPCRPSSPRARPWAPTATPPARPPRPCPPWPGTGTPWPGPATYWRGRTRTTCECCFFAGRHSGSALARGERLSPLTFVGAAPPPLTPLSPFLTQPPPPLGHAHRRGAERRAAGGGGGGRARPVCGDGDVR